MTVEEWRTLLSAVSGPRRVQLVPFRPFDIVAGTAQAVSRNASAPSLYVEVRWISGPTVIFVGPSKNLNAQSAKRVDLADEFFVGTVLMRGEELWIGSTGTVQVPTRIQVGEIQV